MTVTLYTDIYPPPTTLLFSNVYKTEGNQTFTIPTNSAWPATLWLVARALGSGGMGGNPGGGGALAASKVTVVQGEVLKLQIGKVSTGTTLGDTSVLRANNNTIVYADRGRGNGNPGLAANSTGDVKIDGMSGSTTLGLLAGAPASDIANIISKGFGGLGYWAGQHLTTTPNFQAADFGGGGLFYPIFDGDGNFLGSYVSDGAGSGEILLEAYTSDPGAI